MFFSILVPVYNTSPYLRECVDSILGQSFQDFELVLLNDGSTDDSGAICDEYAGQYSNVRVVHKTNEGLMMTRRRGFREAKGEYFICVDSDDKLYDRCALEKIRDTIIRTGCDLVIYNYVYGAGGGRAERSSNLLDCENGHVFEGEEKMRLYEKLLTSNNMNNMWIKCPARHVVDVDVDYSQWKQDICRAEDLFQSYPMLTNAQKIAYLRDPIYFYRWTPGSIGNKARFQYYNSLRCIYLRENEYMEKWGVSEKIRDAAVRRQVTGLMTVVCKCYFTCKQKGDVESWKSFVASVAEDPFFREILHGCDRKKVLKYYRILHNLLCHKWYGAAAFVMDTTTVVSEWKHGGKKHA